MIETRVEMGRRGGRKGKWWNFNQKIYFKKLKIFALGKTYQRDEKQQEQKGLPSVEHQWEA